MNREGFYAEAVTFYSTVGLHQWRRGEDGVARLYIERVEPHLVEITVVKDDAGRESWLISGDYTILVESQEGEDHAPDPG